MGRILREEFKESRLESPFNLEKTLLFCISDILKTAIIKNELNRILLTPIDKFDSIRMT